MYIQAALLTALATLTRASPAPASPAVPALVSTVSSAAVAVITSNVPLKQARVDAVSIIAHKNTNPRPDALAAIRALQSGQPCSPNGIIAFFPEPNFLGDADKTLTITSFEGQGVFCTQLYPEVIGAFNFRSYLGASIIFGFWKNKDCEGDDALVIAGVNNNLENRDIVGEGYLSYIAFYDRDY